mgnify:CR=1 FL=1
MCQKPSRIDVHPAKMARGLVERIFDELFALGAIEKGSLICDPFGGIGSTAIIGNHVFLAGIQ